jgi:two-component system chemotaxis response regulator CheY
MKRILCVDDSATVMTTVDMALKDMVNAGTIELIKYTSPVEMIADAQAGELGNIDFMFCDINMPDMNGMEAVEQLKGISTYTKLPVMMLTTEVADHLKDKAKTLGVRGWITKPFNPRKLQMAIQKTLRI